MNTQQTQMSKQLLTEKLEAVNKEIKIAEKLTFRYLFVVYNEDNKEAHNTVLKAYEIPEPEETYVNGLNTPKEYLDLVEHFKDSFVESEYPTIDISLLYKLAFQIKPGENHLVFLKEITDSETNEKCFRSLRLMALRKDKQINLRKLINYERVDAESIIKLLKENEVISFADLTKEACRNTGVPIRYLKTSLDVWYLETSSGELVGVLQSSNTVSTIEEMTINKVGPTVHHRTSCD